MNKKNRSPDKERDDDDDDDDDEELFSRYG